MKLSGPGCSGLHKSFLSGIPTSLRLLVPFLTEDHLFLQTFMIRQREVFALPVSVCQGFIFCVIEGCYMSTNPLLSCFIFHILRGQLQNLCLTMVAAPLGHSLSAPLAGPAHFESGSAVTQFKLLDWSQEGKRANHEEGACRGLCIAFSQEGNTSLYHRRVSYSVIQSAQGDTVIQDVRASILMSSSSIRIPLLSE